MNISFLRNEEEFSFRFLIQWFLYNFIKNIKEKVKKIDIECLYTYIEFYKLLVKFMMGWMVIAEW